jgi:aspartyl-tRNA synthetase
MTTGEIEVIVDDVKIHNVAKNLPFLFHRQVTGVGSEELLLQYRYLELRQPDLQDNIR